MTNLGMALPWSNTSPTDIDAYGHKVGAMPTVVPSTGRST